MTKGFNVEEKLSHAPAEVWSYLTDFSRAPGWMTGIESMVALDAGPLRVGSRFQFKSRGQVRETEVTALDWERKISLTSRQGGITATYTYLLEDAPVGTSMRLTAVCAASGFWKLLHPVIALAMKQSDRSHLSRLKAAMEQRTGSFD